MQKSFISGTGVAATLAGIIAAISQQKSGSAKLFNHTQLFLAGTLLMLGGLRMSEFRVDMQQILTDEYGRKLGLCMPDRLEQFRLINDQ